ncbi:MAG: pantetheine-phosphate adenylyltransferase [Spirochaetia bacterium]|nr:pantetheine-phosphate adenylyltransferase [Bacteroidota bacterium]MBL7005479.1 pantetheine-phosphate adenylyltransferase [Spirochaetia bacterium]
MIKAMLPGTFDPPTNGHLNLIERAAAIFDKLYVIIADNYAKSCTFSIDERKSMLQHLLMHHTNITVLSWDRMIVDFAREYDVKVMLRGVRALADFSYEFELAMTNKQLNPDIEIFFMPTDPQYFVLRSSAIKELAAFGADISKMVPPEVADLLSKKIKK